jgi:hypothetical protein
MWNKITVEQYQAIHAINNEDGDDIDKLLRIVSILYNKTEKEVNDLPVTTFHKITAEIAALFSAGLPERKTRKRLRIGGRRYMMQYNVGKISYGQWCEIQHFLKGDLIENLHLLAASIAAPMKWGLLTGKNDSRNHEKVSTDFLQANFLDTYSSVVFFCASLTGLKNPIPDSSTRKQSRMIKVTEKEIETWLIEQGLMSGTDGYTAQPK